MNLVLNPSVVSTPMDSLNTLEKGREMVTSRSERASTLHDVAALVGVSPRTVSRVVNDEGGFSEATRTRVLDAVEELSYRPNVMARGLITRRTSTIALVAPVINDPFFPEVADGVQRAAREVGLNMFFASTDDDLDRQNSVLDSLESHAVDGVIIFPHGENSAPLLPFARRGMQMVVIDAPVDHPNLRMVASDLGRGATMAVEHLMSVGRRRLGMIANEKSPADRRWREDGYLAVGAGLESQSIVRAQANFEGGRRGARQLLDEVPDLDGLFAYNDMMAIGAMRELAAMGKAVPDDVAVVGCDDIQMSAFVSPSLTTIQIDRERLGQEAVRTLLALRDGEPDHDDIVVPVSLVHRESA